MTDIVKGDASAVACGEVQSDGRDGIQGTIQEHSMDGRMKLRRHLKRAGKSLSKLETNFLTLVADLGTDVEVQQAQTTLDDSNLFFMSETSIQVGIDDQFDETKQGERGIARERGYARAQARGDSAVAPSTSKPTFTSTSTHIANSNNNSSSSTAGKESSLPNNKGDQATSSLSQNGDANEGSEATPITARNASPNAVPNAKTVHFNEDSTGESGMRSSSALHTKGCSQRRMECLQRRKTQQTLRGPHVFWSVLQAGLKMKKHAIRIRNRRKARKEEARATSEIATPRTAQPSSSDRQLYVATMESIEPTAILDDVFYRHPSLTAEETRPMASSSLSDPTSISSAASGSTRRGSRLLSQVFESVEFSDLPQGSANLPDADEDANNDGNRTICHQERGMNSSARHKKPLLRDEGSLPLAGAQAPRDALHHPEKRQQRKREPLKSKENIIKPLLTRMASLGQGFEIELSDLIDGTEPGEHDGQSKAGRSASQRPNDDNATLDLEPTKAELYDPWSHPITSMQSTLSVTNHDDDTDDGSSSLTQPPTPFHILGTSADDESAKPHIMSPQIMESMQQHLPFSKRGESFWLRYSLVRDGASAATFLRQIRGAQHVVLAMENLEGEVFGAFTSSQWHIQHGHFGSGDAFVWKLRRPREFSDPSSPSSGGGGMTLLEQLHNELDIEVYRWAMQNRCMQTCQKRRIAIGGGTSGTPTAIRLSPPSFPNQQQSTVGDDRNILKESKTNDGSNNNDADDPASVIMPNQWGFAICFEDDNMMEATTSPCVTFHSPALSKHYSDGSRCELINVEAWSLTPCLSVADAEIMEGGKLFLQKNLRL